MHQHRAALGQRLQIGGIVRVEPRIVFAHIGRKHQHLEHRRHAVGHLHQQDAAGKQQRQHAQQVARRHGGRGDVGDHIVFAFHFHKGAVFALHQIAHDARDAVEHHDQAHGSVGQHCVDAQGVQQRKHHRDQQIHDTGAAVIVMRGRKNAVDGFPVAHGHRKVIGLLRGQAHARFQQSQTRKDLLDGAVQTVELRTEAGEVQPRQQQAEQDHRQVVQQRRAHVVQHPAAAFGRGQDRTDRVLFFLYHAAPPWAAAALRCALACEGISLSGSPITW